MCQHRTLPFIDSQLPKVIKVSVVLFDYFNTIFKLNVLVIIERILQQYFQMFILSEKTVTFAFCLTMAMILFLSFSHILTCH